MSSIWTNTQIAEALGSIPLHTSSTQTHTGVSIDSRSCKPENVFVCIRGENTDGHRYIHQACAAGASALIVEEAQLTSGALELPRPGSINVFMVPNGISALQDLASSYRQRMSELYIIGVSGSNGKTSCKEILAGLLENIPAISKSYATPGNLNNHIGVPLSILGIAQDTQMAVIEMGMNHTGEIDVLTKIAQPNIAMITSVANAHMEFFASVDEVGFAKLEIINSMKPGACLFWPKGTSIEDFVKQRCQQMKLDLDLFDSLDMLINNNKIAATVDGISVHFDNLKVTNAHYFSPVMAMNFLNCMNLLLKANMDKEQISSAANKVKPVSPGRFEVKKIPRSGLLSDQLVVDDSYNANPDSFARALRALRNLLPNGRLALLAGEMAELGSFHSEGHADVARLVWELDYQLMVFCGSSKTFLMLEKINHSNSGNVRNYKNVTDFLADFNSIDWSGFDGILIKGSRSSKMELASRKFEGIDYV